MCMSRKRKHMVSSAAVPYVCVATRHSQQKLTICSVAHFGLYLYDYTGMGFRICRSSGSKVMIGNCGFTQNQLSAHLSHSQTQGKVWWYWNSFLVVQAHDLIAMLCNWSCTGCTLLRNGMQNRRAAFWLATAKSRQLTLYNIASLQDAMKIVEMQSDWHARKQECWAYKNQENVTRPFPSQRVGSGDETTVHYTCFCNGGS